MIVKLLTEHHLEFLSLTGGYTGSSKSTFVKMPHCWKSHVTAQLCLQNHYFHFQMCTFDINTLIEISKYVINCLKIDKETVYPFQSR